MRLNKKRMSQNFNKAVCICLTTRIFSLPDPTLRLPTSLCLLLFDKQKNSFAHSLHRLTPV